MTKRDQTKLHKLVDKLFELEKVSDKLQKRDDVLFNKGDMTSKERSDVLDKLEDVNYKIVNLQGDIFNLVDPEQLFGG